MILHLVKPALYESVISLISVRSMFQLRTILNALLVRLNIINKLR